MTDQTRKICYFGTIFFLIIVYLSYRFFRNDSLYKNGLIESAYVNEINHGTPKGGNIVIKYFFIYKGRKYNSGMDAGLPYSVRTKLLNTYFPVLIDTTNPGNNILLVDIKKWKNVNNEFPDSLNWIREY